jgi:hypothetical protein
MREATLLSIFVNVAKVNSHLLGPPWALPLLRDPLSPRRSHTFRAGRLPEQSGKKIEP